MKNDLELLYLRINDDKSLSLITKETEDDYWLTLIHKRTIKKRYYKYMLNI